MTETGLIIAEVAFLVLLYLFVWAIIRASSRQLRADQAPLPAPVEEQPLVVPMSPPPADPAPDEPPAVETAAEPAHDPAEPDWDALRASAALPEAPEDADLSPPTEIGGAMVAGAAVGALGSAGDPDDADFDSDELLEASDAPPLEGAAARAAERDSAFDLASDIHPRLVVEESPTLPSGEEFDLTGGVTIGRSSSSDLAIDDSFVSHMHARILRRGQYYFIEDLGSTNGTFLNDQRVERDAQLKVRDVLRMGDTVLRYEE
jgi:hypothetical protein